VDQYLTTITAKNQYITWQIESSAADPNPVPVFKKGGHATAIDLELKRGTGRKFRQCLIPVSHLLISRLIHFSSPLVAEFHPGTEHFSCFLIIRCPPILFSSLSDQQQRGKLALFPLPMVIFYHHFLPILSPLKSSKN
jgi:hypothetical protein